MNSPKFLHPGDSIGIVSPGAQIDEKLLSYAVAIIEEFGFKVALGKNVLNKYGYFAGTDDERLSDIQSMMDDTGIKAILFSRGGYGSIRLLEKLDYSGLKKQPKWIIGFSDITVFHVFLNTYLQIASIHGPMPVNYKSFSKEYTEAYFDFLQGMWKNIQLKNHALNRLGEAKGKLVGGNLSVLYSLRGTRYDLDYRDKILFIEDVGENLYHIDRMLMNLKLGRVFKQIKGLIIGAFTDMKDTDHSFASSAYEVISKAVAEYHFPVLYDFPAGHINNNQPIWMGAEILLCIKKFECKIEYLV